MSAGAGDLGWLYIGAAILLDGAVGMAGGLLPDRWLARFRTPLVGFAAGALLSASFLDMLPEAIEAAGRGALAWALAGFLATAVFEQAAAARRSGPPGTRPALAAALLGSDALHNLGDGAAIAAAFLASTRLGVVTTLAVLAHEVPQEVGDYVLLRESGKRRRRALLALAAVQLTAVIGAAAVVFTASLFARASGIVLAVAGGTFLHIGATDLLPEVLHRAPDRRARLRATLGLLLGIATVAVLEGVW